MFGRLVTSSPSTWAAVSPSTSAASRRGRGSVTAEPRDEAAQGQLVPVRTEAAQHADRGRCKHRVAALRLAREDVCNVDLDERDLRRRECIAECEARMAVGAGVDDRTGDALTERLHVVDQRALAIALRELQLDAQLSRDVGQPRLDVGERLAAVQRGLARAEEV